MLRFFYKKFKKHKHKHDAPKPPQRVSSLYKTLESLQQRREPEYETYKTGFMDFLNSDSNSVKKELPPDISKIEITYNLIDFN